MGIERQGRPREDRCRVELVAARERREADRLRAVRQVLAQRLPIASERWVHGIAHDARDPFLRRVVLRERRGRGRVLRCERQQPVELRDRSLRHQPRRRDAVRDPLACHVAPRVQVRGDRAQPCLVAVEALRRVRRLHRGDLRQRLSGPEEVGGGTQSVGPLVEFGDRPSGDRLQHVKRAAHRDVERRPVDRGELVERRAVHGRRSRSPRLSRVAQPVVVTLVADHGAEHRFQLEEFFPIPVGQRPCALHGVHVSDAPRVGRWVLEEPEDTGAVHLERGAAHETRRLGAQERDDLAEVVGISHAPDGADLLRPVGCVETGQGQVQRDAVGDEILRGRLRPCPEPGASDVRVARASGSAA